MNLNFWIQLTTPTPKADFTTIIPKDVVIHNIFTKLEVLDLVACTRVNKCWQRLAHIDFLWKKHFPDVAFAKNVLLRKPLNGIVARSFDEILALLNKALDNTVEGKLYSFTFKNPYIPPARINCCVGYHIPDHGKEIDESREFIWLYKPKKKDWDFHAIKGDDHKHLKNGTKNYISAKVLIPEELNQYKLFMDINSLFRKEFISMDLDKKLMPFFKAAYICIIALTVFAGFSYSPTKT